jgi:hypothetical protein
VVHHRQRLPLGLEAGDDLRLSMPGLMTFRATLRRTGWVCSAMSRFKSKSKRANQQQARESAFFLLLLLMILARALAPQVGLIPKQSMSMSKEHEQDC